MDCDGPRGFVYNPLSEMIQLVCTECRHARCDCTPKPALKPQNTGGWRASKYGITPMSEPARHYASRQKKDTFISARPCICGGTHRYTNSNHCIACAKRRSARQRTA